MRYEALGKLIHIKHGYAFKSEYFSLDTGTQVVLTPGNFYEEGGFKLRPDKDRFYTGNFPKEFVLKKNDLIIAMTEQTYGLLGSPALIPADDRYLHNQRLGKFELLDRKRACLRYLYHLFCLKSLRDEISVSATGTKIRHTAPERIYKLIVPLPPLPIQRKIAAVLSAYDDLIENNNRRIAILEKMAEELYREWFVRLRFPGHEKVRIVKGVPEGWEVKKLVEVADITYGFPFEGARFNSNGIGKPIIRIRNIPESSTADYTDEVVNEKYIVKKGDFLVGMDGEFHMNHWFGDDVYLVQRVCRVKAKSPGHAGYLAKALYGPIKFYESILMGATVGHLGAKHLNSIDILIPSKSLDRQLTLLKNNGARFILN